MINRKTPIVHFNHKGQIHCEDGPAIIFSDSDIFVLVHRRSCYDPNISKIWFVLNGRRLNPNTAWKNPNLKKFYPALINSMIVYNIHKS